MRPLLALVLAAVGCGLNPAFLEPTEGTFTSLATGTTTTPADPTTTAPPPTAQPDPDTTATTTTEPLPTDTSVDPTGPDNTTTEPVDTTTTTTTTTTTEPPCPVPCQACEVCLAGTCVVNAGGACNFPSNPKCEDRVWGLDIVTGKCHAYQQSAPECVGTNLCEHVCSDPGAVAVDCGPQCLLDQNNCTAGMPVAAVSAQSVCAGPMQMTSGCHSGCEDALDGKFTYNERSCNLDHVCATTAMIDCEYAVCSDAGCKANCQDSSDCIMGATCNEALDKCQPG